MLIYLFRYLREVFHNSLPHESTLRKWSANLDASPGFTKQVFNYLKSKEERMSVNPIPAGGGGGVHLTPLPCSLFYIAQKVLV